MTAAKKVAKPNNLRFGDWGEGLKFALETKNTKSVARAKLPADVIRVCAQHNLRRGNEAHRHRFLIHAERTPTNSVLLGSDDPDVIAELAHNALCELGIVPSRVDTIMAIELVYQAPEGWDVPVFWDACIRSALVRFPHILSAVVHRDQGRTHMHILAIPIVDGNKLDGSAMSSGENRIEAQRSDFMAHMRYELSLRPDRKPRPATVVAGRDTLATVTGTPARGPGSGNPLAHQPPGPQGKANSLARDLILRSLSAVSALFSDEAFAGTFPDAPPGPVTVAPRPTSAGTTWPSGLSANSSGETIARLMLASATHAEPADDCGIDRHTGPPTGANALPTSSPAPASVKDTGDDDIRVMSNGKGQIPSSVAGAHFDLLRHGTDAPQAPPIYRLGTHSDRTCRDCTNRTRSGTCGQPVDAGLGEIFILVWAPCGHAANCKAFVSKDTRVSSTSVRLRSSAVWDWRRVWSSGVHVIQPERVADEALA